MFREVEKESLDAREQRILRFWKTHQTFEKSVLERKKAPHYAFYDGPPFATGLPHYGHFLAGTIKDVVLRYKTMEGFYVPRRFGWDCHGLPVEYEVEKSKQLSGSRSIEAFGIANFNEACRSIVLRYTEEWKDQVERMGRWVDFSQTYRTMDLSFMESVWWVFKQLYEKGLVYQGYKVMPFSAKLGTPLSNFEAGENYKEVDDPSLTVSFPLIDEPETSLLVWTTTPWTLISNLAIMAGPEVEYVKVSDQGSGKQWILAKARLSAHYKSEEEYKILEIFSGKALEGKRYQPMFPYFADRASEGAFRVILEDSVSIEEGTGLVHSAPAFGEVDFYACQRANISLVCPVDNNGQFTEQIREHAGKFVKDADKEIIRRIKEGGRLVRHATCHHRYPFCWRSDTPLIYKVVSTWFVAVEKIKGAMLANNAKIHWTPEHLKEGRFGKWLEGARDWAISRNRYWGTPIPLWIADDGEICVIGSVQELEEATGQKIGDIHRHFIDDLQFYRNGKRFKRVPEVFDCWFESGSMPYAQNHYPFENRKLFEEIFPADFIAEGLDQTRGWFYTLTVLSTALFDQPAFKNVIVNGIVLASDGTKMSKRLQNYPDPLEVIRQYGADAVRLYMMHSGAVKADDLRFQEKGVELVLRQILIPYWNAFTFFHTYARLYAWEPSVSDQKFPEATIDQWILSELQKLIDVVRCGMDAYNLAQAVEPFVAFIDQLTNWYIRRSRRRFWADEDTQDRREAFATLYQVLLTLSKVTAPFIPFLSEAIYQHLREDSMPESVHLCDFPSYQPQARKQRLEQEMVAVQQTVSLGHGLRKEHRLKVRQPLMAAKIASGNPEVIEFLKEQQQLIAEELNVREVQFFPDEQPFVQLRAKPNFRVLGKKVGSLMKAVQEAVHHFGYAELLLLQQGTSVRIHVEGQEIELTPEDVQVDREVHEGLVAENIGEITIALDTHLNEDLILEGFAREIVNKVNTMRRESGLEITDRIRVMMQTTERVQSCFSKYGAYIQSETLAIEFLFGTCDGAECDLNGEPARITCTKF